MAVAGFRSDELDVTLEDRTLTITGRASDEEDDRSYLHRGIAKRAFERSFRLADTVKVEGANFENGLLRVDLVREIPEHMKPRRIRIESTGDTKRIGDTEKPGKQAA